MPNNEPTNSPLAVFGVYWKMEGIREGMNNEGNRLDTCPRVLNAFRQLTQIVPKVHERA
jgi:hypothetical protein